MGDQDLDWRVGLAVRPKLRTHALYYERGEVLAVHPSGHGGIFDGDGVLRIEMQSGRVILAPAGEWMTG